MFDWKVCLLTLQQAGVLCAYLVLGFCLSRTGALPKDADKTMSKLVTLLFGPAYNIANLSVSMRPENLSTHLKLFGFGAAVILGAFALAVLLGHSLGRTPLEKRSLIYGFTFSNYGYFGYPLVAGVFGQTALGQMMVFCLAISLLTNTLGYVLFAPKLSWRKMLLTPLVLAVLLGSALGLTGVQLPGSVRSFLEGAGNCMSPVSMVLAGFVLGRLPLKELVSGWRPWLYGAIRLMALPAITVGLLYCLGARGTYLLLPGLFMALPLGMNVVVFPASFGHDTRDNAKICFVSFLLALLTMPFVFSLLSL